MIKIYNEYKNSNRYNVTFKHNSYQLIQYLVTISNKMFTEEFEVNNEADLYELVRFVGEDWIVN